MAYLRGFVHNRSQQHQIHQVASSNQFLLKKETANWERKQHLQAAAMNIINGKSKLSNNGHNTVVVILQYWLVEIEGKVAVVILFYTNIHIKGRNRSPIAPYGEVEEEKKTKPCRRWTWLRTSKHGSLSKQARRQGSRCMKVGTRRLNRRSTPSVRPVEHARNEKKIAPVNSNKKNERNKRAPMHSDMHLSRPDPQGSWCTTLAVWVMVLSRMECTRNPI